MRLPQCQRRRGRRPRSDARRRVGSCERRHRRPRL